MYIDVKYGIEKKVPRLSFWVAGWALAFIFNGFRDFLEIY